MKKKIAIVEDNPTLRDGYAFIINSANKNFQVVSTFESAEDFFKETQTIKNIDIVLMDIDLPGIDGIEATQKLSVLQPEVEIIMFTVWQEPEKVFSALERGASGYVLKGASGIEIIGALEELVEGGAPMSPAIARLIIQKFHKNPSSPLNKLETEIVKKLAEGKGYKTIATELEMNSVDNVKYYIKKIYEALEVHNREQAVKIAKANNWI